MALTWEFYVAMVLLVIAILIVVAFVYLLYNPQNDLFDRIRRKFRKKGDITPGVSNASGPAVNSGVRPVARR